jgi:hypothetical protein
MLMVAPALQDLDTRVRCPSCGLVFQASEFRFFGFVPPQTMKLSVAAFVLTLVLASVYLLFMS